MQRLWTCGHAQPRNSRTFIAQLMLAEQFAKKLANFKSALWFAEHWLDERDEVGVFDRFASLLCLLSFCEALLALSANGSPIVKLFHDTCTFCPFSLSQQARQIQLGILSFCPFHPSSRPSSACFNAPPQIE
ncbi:hypothetical protein CAOG_009611 [Capsaspora owczarzaki ATCC 30864]|uniref:Uncharacterized protein n=1 Tax=Capsaspora owczarzaki (strain ATCC 30864) TaxID=595528 RepID=A0A0D2WNF1_CAPO3|nr:hypothetical protein CAOG_009611 [Capsaspora owczarzaki ATCC 30864]